MAVIIVTLIWLAIILFMNWDKIEWVRHLWYAEHNLKYIFIWIVVGLTILFAIYGGIWYENL